MRHTAASVTVTRQAPTTGTGSTAAYGHQGGSHPGRLAHPASLSRETAPRGGGHPGAGPVGGRLIMLALVPITVVSDRHGGVGVDVLHRVDEGHSFGHGALERLPPHDEPSPSGPFVDDGGANG